MNNEIIFPLVLSLQQALDGIQILLVAFVKGSMGYNDSFFVVASFFLMEKSEGKRNEQHMENNGISTSTLGAGSSLNGDARRVRDY